MQSSVKSLTKLVGTSTSSSFTLRNYAVGQNVLNKTNYFLDQRYNKHNVNDIFANKKVVVVGIPGNSPVDTFQHVPSFVNNCDKIYSKGVNYIVCLSTLDPPMLKANRISLDPNQRLTHLCDENGAFAEELHLCQDLEVHGLGVKAPYVKLRRFALIVDNGNIVFESIEKHDDDYSHTDAETILKNL
ncbi:hypothetical protein PPL_08498 [Heterostelium album PN500]|uniref:Redoxin domain-containing protein n=1 Tax=Heterostelium pallidum (strain ATCC 26659 / Pp 5 / PN500) TaxID=670386 RepID=D3BIC9_HETP5|nr:hypothetical protein PPL_08498 [Heterostelium album PN500]EFA79029.1 hypothetical protein PPL_08498 [Heterostelium album PN500]|eukprot:XP_020431152.1 hypothetical protein PPL_08498 [Heterostelium album PN500]